MEQLRSKVLLALLALAVALGSASVANAQTAFQMSALTRDVRVEGLAEAVGQVTFAATTTGTIKAASTMSLDYGTAIETGTGTVSCVANTACAVTTNFTVAVSGNQVTITFVTDVGFIAGNTITVSGVRVNANGATTTTINAVASAVVPPAFAAINPITFFITNTVTVATIRSPAVTVGGTAAAGGILTCVASATGAFTVDITETFNQAYLSKIDEDGLGGTGVAGANSINMVVRISFASVPIGVAITLGSFTGSAATLSMTSAVGAVLGPTWTLGVGAGAAVTFTSASGAQTGNFDITITATSGTGAVERIRANFTAATAASITAGAASVSGAVTLRGGTGAAGAASSIPRFTSGAPNNPEGTRTAFGVTDCVTFLLFPFVANTARFNTGIAIANTTQDHPTVTTGNARHQDGACTLTLYFTNTDGTVGSASAPPITIIAGATAALDMAGTSQFAGRQGYIIANCGFLNAHGLALIVDGFQAVPNGHSQGYLALIIPNPSIVSRAVPGCPTAGSGECLNE